MEDNYYNNALNNFDTFCDQFESAAAKRYTGVDNDSRQPIDNAEVQRITPTVVREIDNGGAEGVSIRTPPIDVQATRIGELSDDSRDIG